MKVSWTIELEANLNEKEIAMKAVKQFKPGVTNDQKLSIIRECVSHEISGLDDLEYYGMTEEVEEQFVEAVCKTAKVPYAKN